MAYDSDGSWDSGTLDLDISVPSGDAAAAPDNAASAALAAAGATAMAAAVMQDDVRGAGWDAPPAAVFAGAPSVSSITGLLFDNDDDDDWRDDGSGRRADPPLSGKAMLLQQVALRAYTLHPDFCHQSTAEVADHYGHSELDGLSANQQVAAFQSRWREVDGAQAATLAGRGVLVIAGLAGAGNAGHTAIVIPGSPAAADRKTYPRVCGGGLPMRRSDGSKTAADAWTQKERAQVRYFTPETRSWLRRALGSLLGL
jgi:hypothetical protein